MQTPEIGNNHPCVLPQLSRALEQKSDQPFLFVSLVGRKLAGMRILDDSKGSIYIYIYIHKHIYIYIYIFIYRCISMIYVNICKYM